MSTPFTHGSPEYTRWLEEDRDREDAEAAAAQAAADAATAKKKKSGDDAKN